jgi:hypothetical protein
MNLLPTEVDDAVFRVRSDAWARYRAFMTECDAVARVGIVLGLAEVAVEETVRRFIHAGAVIPELPMRRWGLRRAGASDVGGGRSTDLEAAADEPAATSVESRKQLVAA